MVLRMRVGVSSTVTGAIRRVKSALELSCGPAAGCMPGIPGCACDIRSLAAPNSIAATPPNFMNSLRSTVTSHPARVGAANLAAPPHRKRNPLTVAWLVQDHPEGNSQIAFDGLFSKKRPSCRANSAEKPSPGQRPKLACGDGLRARNG